VIEGQYRSSTVRLVDTFAEHDVLEALLEASKPPVPEPCRHLDYQFWSPFRYGRYPRDSRFRREGRTPGVWYGAEQPLTAISEAVWNRLAFFAASPGTALPRRPVEHTAVMAEIRAQRALDLTAPALSDLGNWTDPDDYTDCLALADAMHEADGGAILYRAVRHPVDARNVAVLRCDAFARPAPVQAQTWHILLGSDLVRVSCETTGVRVTYRRGETALTFADA
jgi:RES domain